MQAPEEAVIQAFPDGSRNHDLSLMSVIEPRPTRKKFVLVASLLAIRDSFTSCNDRESNMNTER